MQTTIGLTQVVSYAFDLSHHSDGWITPFGRAVGTVPYEAAIWKPGPKAASIYELTAHAFNYLNRLNRDLAGEKRVGFEDWPEVIPSKAEWEKLREQVKTVEAAVRGQVANFTSDRLAGPDALGNDPIYEAILDIAIHDAYHAGQVVKLMQLWGPPVQPSPIERRAT